MYTYETALARYKAILKQRMALGHAMGVLSYDEETVMPKKAAPQLAETMGILSEEMYKLSVNDEVREVLAVLSENEAKLDPITKREVELELRDIKRLERVPQKEYAELSALRAKASSVWRQAKQTNDYQLFKPYLKQLVEAMRRLAGYMFPEKNAYDALLEYFSEGLSQAMLDPLFAKIKAALVPVIHAVQNSPYQIDDAPFKKPFPIEGQRIISNFVMDFLGIDRDRCIIGEVEHPFTTNFSKNDVRITTHYYENALISGMMSTAHEGGHSLYELDMGDDLIGSPLSGGATMTLHESQSRLFENMICRTKEFAAILYPKLLEVFPKEMEGISEEELYLALNKSEPSLIRTEADELTYPLHIMIRYDIEKMLINGDVDVDELPAVWNRLYKEYLGIDVPNDTCGVLQDSHWSGGMIGYFPSYCVGSAYAAQIYHEMSKTVDINAAIAGGGVEPIVAWLTEKLHRYGSLLTPKQLANSVLCGEFNPDYYINYLTEKFTTLYKL